MISFILQTYNNKISKRETIRHLKNKCFHFYLKIPTISNPDSYHFVVTLNFEKACEKCHILIHLITALFCLVSLCNEINEKLMASMQHVLIHQYLKIFINKVAKYCWGRWGVFVWTDQHEEINKAKQMPKGIQIVTVPKILYPYRVITDKPHSTIQKKNIVSDFSNAWLSHYI